MHFKEQENYSVHQNMALCIWYNFLVCDKLSNDSNVCKAEEQLTVQ